MSLRRLIAVLLPILLVMLTTVHAAEAPYRSYTYDRFHNAIPSPNGYLPKRQLFGTDFGIGSFSNPNDLFVDKERNDLYIVDSGNNRIVVIDSLYWLVRVITEFRMDNNEPVFMESPKGIFVTRDGTMYIADQGNARIIVSDRDLNVLNIFGKPESDLLAKDFEYKPSKVVVDEYGRIFIQATGVFQGLICLSSDGGFLNYFGSNKVEMTAQKLVQQLWKKILTRDQARAMQNFVPIEYSNIYIDKEGFIFATAAASSTFENQVMCLNPVGSDILKWHRLDWFAGSNFEDIHVDDLGFITVVDSTRGRVYQVEPDDGVMMFSFGGIGNMMGTFTGPVSIESFNGSLLVLDNEKNAITEFQLTTFGKAVRRAQALYMEGRYEENIEPWLEVVKRDSNYLFAYIGLGKAYYQMEDYGMAMKYFKQGYSKADYSDALKEYSLIVMRSNFAYIVLGLLLIFAAIVFYKVSRRKKHISDVYGGAVR
jgi:tetratricopeptide (TPR) repeat protein